MPAPTKAAPASVVGKQAPDFTLDDLAGNPVKLSSFKGKTIVLEWFNPGCPYVKKSHPSARSSTPRGSTPTRASVWLAINSGAAGKQGHDGKDNQDAAKTWSVGHPILRDLDGKIGKLYGATNTPHMFVIDTTGTVVYGGAIDNSPDGEKQSPTGGTLINYVDAALADLAAKRKVKVSSTKAYGCGVKYGS